MPLPKNGTAYRFILGLDSRADLGFQVNPTIVAGDFQVSIDGGALANLATLPVVAPAGSVLVQVDLSAAEMTGDKIAVFASDVAGDEWSDVVTFIDAATVTVEDIWDGMFNDSNVVVGGGGARTLTLFEDDGTTEKAKVVISGDGLTRTKLPPTP